MQTSCFHCGHETEPWYVKVFLVTCTFLGFLVLLSWLGGVRV